MIFTRSFFMTSSHTHLPIFPLSGALLLPDGWMPLNIFEEKYLKMVDDVLTSKDRLIGMIQPMEPNGDTLYSIGCAGKICAFSEASGGRYLITLSGFKRFRIDHELHSNKPYRLVEPIWIEEDDAQATDYDLDYVYKIVDAYFEEYDIDCQRDLFSHLDDARILNCLPMVCPFAPEEKQALLEAQSQDERVKKMVAIMEMALHNKDAPKITSQH